MMDPLQEVLEAEDYPQLMILSQKAILAKEDARGYFYLGKAYEGYGREKLADNAFQRSISFPQTNIYFGNQIALYYEAKGNIPKAADVYRRLTEIFPQDSQDVSVKLGRLYYDQKRYQDAIRIFSDTIFRDERQANPLGYFVALSYYSLRNYTKAEEYFELAQKNGFTDPDLSLKLGEIKIKKGKLKQGIALMTEGLGQFKELQSPATYLTLAEAYARSNNKPMAAKLYRQAIDAGSTDINVYLDYGAMATKSSDYQGVIDVLEPIAGQNATSGELLFYIANAYDQLGNADAAIQYFKKVLDVGYGNREYVRGRIRDLQEAKE